ncbi:hypothetical protein BO94DRAFT_196461 [Aspergillus sclerotioniger CBS 115572]|uniref:Uncharacterized protein n=1 Tax=Aspergillus sclerotioniger CBS 115572 TaxID=1450535 RepID=A0A317VSI5_9EURO|nr:hypothetical protein BO94DRAFT_196461 [Aspergillus sclerotioniger CBS 115572]PWY77296.1 hypothetical protein BO94DRAFT_196461 [Aspergillus sclerotioniger CBS 115572]
MVWKATSPDGATGTLDPRWTFTSPLHPQPLSILSISQLPSYSAREACLSLVGSKGGSGGSTGPSQNIVTGHRTRLDTSDNRVSSTRALLEELLYLWVPRLPLMEITQPCGIGGRERSWKVRRHCPGIVDSLRNGLTSRLGEQAEPRILAPAT